MSLADVYTLFRAPKKKAAHTFTDDDRELSKQAREMKMQLAQMQMQIQQVRMERQLALEEQRLQMITGAAQEGAEGGVDPMQAMMLMMLQQFGQGQQATAQPVVPTTAAVSGPALISYSNEQIEEILDKLPKLQRRMLPHAPEELMRVKMREMFNADDDSINRAIAQIRA